jgi:hypothetical protein
MLKTLKRVLAHGAQIPHDQCRLAKHPGVEALQDKVLL